MASRSEAGTPGTDRAARTPVRRALISVSDKAGVVALAQRLAALGIELLSTGGTAKLLRDAGLDVREVADYTGFPEIMDGRVKTLHSKVHGGLLARRGTDDAVMREHGIEAIDLLVINLYPFAATLARPDVTYEMAVENIDIGGPAMLRGAAKNHAHVGVLVDPADYDPALAEIAAGGLPFALRQRLAAKAYAHTAGYDAVIASWMQQQCGGDAAFPDRLDLRFCKRLDLRYGENPHQRAALYTDPGAVGACVGGARQLHGKELSFNNIADADTAFECVRQFDVPACVIVKHANPCGVALATSAREAYERAYTTDPTSAFGGVIAFNRELDMATAAAIVAKQFVEVIIAPTVAPDAIKALATKQNVRVLAAGDLALGTPATPDLRGIAGGLLVQDRDTARLAPDALRIVSTRTPTSAEIEDLLFAWNVCKFVKSNAIVYARDAMTLGVGAGQMSRVVSSKIAAMKAREEGLDVSGAVLASDAFFPFRDGLDVAAGFGIRAVIQPGGSVRDSEIIAAADEHDMAMVFTGMRHFRH